METFYSLNSEEENPMYFFHRVKDEKHYDPSTSSEIYAMLMKHKIITGPKKIIVFDFHPVPDITLEEKLADFQKNPTLSNPLQVIDILSFYHKDSPLDINEDYKNLKTNPEKEIEKCKFFLNQSDLQVLPLVYNVKTKTWNSQKSRSLPSQNLSSNLKIRKIYQYIENAEF